MTENLNTVVTAFQNGAIDIAQVRSAISGQLISTEDEGYDKARTIFYGGIDRRPIFIVKAANANDVAYVIRLAHEAKMPLAIRAGGHSMAGYSVVEGGIVLDVSSMKGLEIDVENRTAWAEAGLTAGEYTKAVGKYKLATGFGDTGGVGIAGITLGGGIGYFIRKYGLTIDSLLAAEIVTADGQILQIDEQNHPDLFWAIRGGGGNFGVVTRFKFRLYPVDKVIGGILVLPASPEILKSIIAFSESAPEELSLIASVMTAPPMPFIPKEYYGKLISFILPVYLGDIESGEKALAPLRALATPIVDMLKPMSYPEIYAEEAEYHPTAAARTMFLDKLEEEQIQTIFENLRATTAQMTVTQVRVLGGAMARVAEDATAFAHRQRKMMINVAAMYGNPEDKEKYEAWIQNFADKLRDGETGAYVNFLGDEGENRVREAYPGATWERLRAVKAKYDPTNLFRLNQNIPAAQS